MFYKKGVDITNDKQMFEFLKNHFEYHTMSSWNGLKSIANNVKLYNLGLSGDWCIAYDLLCSGEYETLEYIIRDWEAEHPGYEVFFNGRSSGYLVLYYKNDNTHVLPCSILESDTYEDYKEYCKEYYGCSVRANRDELVHFTKLIQDFDRLCDLLRDYCDELSNSKFEVIEMDKSVARFNEEYADDLCYLDFRDLVCDEDGKVDVSEIMALDSLYEAFIRIANRPNSGYCLVTDENCNIMYTSK